MNDGEVNAVINIQQALSQQESGPNDLQGMTNHNLHVVVLLKETTGKS